MPPFEDLTLTTAVSQTWHENGGEPEPAAGRLSRNSNQFM
jgi:hypothetical protein